MQEFYFTDVNKHFSFRGIVPHNDVNWPPFDFFRYEYALNQANLFGDILKVQYSLPIPQEFVNRFILEKVDQMILEQLQQSHPKQELHTLLTDDTLSKKEQLNLLKGLILNPTDLLWLNREAQDLDYLMDVYHEQKYPQKFNNQKKPTFFHQKLDMSIECVGETTMTEGEMRALLEQRKVVQAHIYHKDNLFHCFYFTFNGLLGKESGTFGSHYHYLSNKFNLSKERLVARIKSCDMPSSSSPHIIIKR